MGNGTISEGRSGNGDRDAKEWPDRRTRGDATRLVYGERGATFAVESEDLVVECRRWRSHLKAVVMYQPPNRVE
jgi:hypothetical protein